MDGSGSRLGDEKNIQHLKVMKKEVHNWWVTVTKAWGVLRLRMEERLPISKVPANKMNKQSRKSEKGWSSNLGFGRGVNKS
jgi:hypothetical protein